jgi:hypothetical protein
VVECSGGGEQRRTDRRQPARASPARARCGGESARTITVGDPRPSHRDRDLVGVGPLEDRHLDAAGNGSDRIDQAAILEGPRDTVALQQIRIRRNAGGDIDGHRKGKRRTTRRSSPRQ